LLYLIIKLFTFHVNPILAVTTPLLLLCIDDDRPQAPFEEEMEAYKARSDKGKYGCEEVVASGDASTSTDHHTVARCNHDMGIVSVYKTTWHFVHVLAVI
jgi:hypothetical protein